MQPRYQRMIRRSTATKAKLRTTPTTPMTTIPATVPGGVETSLRFEHPVADTFARSAHLADHHQDDGDGQGGAQADHDVRAGAGDDDAPQPLPWRHAVADGHVDELAVDAPDPGDRVEQHRPHRAEGDDDDLGQRAGAGQHHDHERHQQRRRDGTDELDDWVGGAIQPRYESEQQAEGDADGGGDEVAEPEADQAGHEVAADLLEQPLLAAGRR